MPDPMTQKLEWLFVATSARAVRLEDALKKIRKLTRNQEVLDLVADALNPPIDPIMRTSEFGPRLSVAVLDAVQRSGALGPMPEGIPVQSITLVASSLLARDQVLISNGTEVMEFKLISLDTEGRP